MSKKEKATAITKRNIQESFWYFYSRMPMNKIRINAVMEHAGYNRGTFYEYFKSLDDVLKSIEEKIYFDFVERLSEFNERDCTVSELLMVASEIAIDNREYFAVLLGENGDSRFRETMIQGISSVIEIQICQKLGHEVDVENNRVFKHFVTFVATGLCATLVKWADEQDEIDDDFINELKQYFDAVAEVSNEFALKILTIK